MQKTQKREVKFCKYFIVCTKHGLACPMKKGVEPKHRTLKGEVLNGMIFGEPAFYFKYGGGLKPSNLKLHYPEDHGFELIPVPKRLKPKADNGGLYKLDEADEVKVREFLGETQRNGGYYVTDQRRPRQVGSEEKQASAHINTIPAVITVEEESKSKRAFRKMIMNGQKKHKTLNSFNYNEADEEDDNHKNGLGENYNNEAAADSELPLIKKVKFEDSEIQEIVYHKEDTGQREEEEEKKGEDRARGGDNQIQINLGAASAKKKNGLRKRASEKTFDSFYSTKSKQKRKCKIQPCKKAIKYLFTEVGSIKDTCAQIQESQLKTTEAMSIVTQEVRKQTEMIANMSKELKVQIPQQPRITERVKLKKM